MAAELDDYHFKFKISIVGDSGVGKTTFLDCKHKFLICSHQSESGESCRERTLDRTSHKGNGD